MKTLKLDMKGYQELLLDLTDAEAKLHDLRFHGNKEKIKTLRWYDDPENFGRHLEEQRILKKIKMIQEQLKNSTIVVKDINQNAVDLDDIIRLEVINNENSKEELLVKLVGSFGNFAKEPLEISVNSPLGDAIYHKTLGDKVTYNVGSELFSVIIREKLL